MLILKRTTHIYKKHMSSISIKRLFFFTCSFVLFSCVPVHYYDLEVGQVYVDSNDKGLLPQEGTTITIDIGLIHEKVSTKMTPGYQAKLYRYRVMLDGELYSSGITGIELTTDIQVPLIANESYKTKSVIIEGSGSTEYDSEDHWKDWEVLFEGTQDCLAESDTLRYAQLENKRLRVDIELDSTTLFYDFLPGFSSEAFKRLLLDNTKIECTCYIYDSHIDINYYDVFDYFKKIPQNAISGKIENGVFGMDVSYPGFNFKMEDTSVSYSTYTPIATIDQNSKWYLSLLKIKKSHSQKIIWTKLVLSLTD